MTVPGRTAIALAAGLAVLLVVAPFLSDARAHVFPAAVVGNALLLLAVWWRGRSLGRARVKVEPMGADRFEIGREGRVRYAVESTARRPVRVRVRQAWPGSVSAPRELAAATVRPGERVELTLPVTPLERGVIRLDPVEVDLSTGDDLARRRYDLPHASPLTVYPPLRHIAQYERLRQARALGQTGVHRVRMTGTGREFEQLREYSPDDDFRLINWKATARRRSPMTNTYQAERSQDLLIAVDTSRMMASPVTTDGEPGLRTLDHAIDAAMLLAHVSRRSGDRVGLALFRETVTEYHKPAASMAAHRRLTDALVHAEPASVFPSYAELAVALRTRQSRRATVFLFTDLNDPQLVTNLVEAVPLIARRHVVVVVGLRDGLIERVADGRPEDRAGLYQVLAARELADERDAQVRSLTRRGVMVLSVDADRITTDVINRYLSIRMRQVG